MGRLMGGVLLWLGQTLLFCLSIAMANGSWLFACLALGGLAGFIRVRDRELRRERMRDQVWAEVAEQTPATAESELPGRAEKAWKREVLLDCLRLCVEAALAALLCLLLMAAFVRQAGGRSAMRALQVLYRTSGSLTPACAFYLLARMGLLVLTPLHALLVLARWLLHRRTPDFSDLSRDLPSPPDHTGVARPLPLIELSGDPQSDENRALLTQEIRKERKRSRAGILVWALSAALILLTLIGLYNSRWWLAVTCICFLLCSACIWLPSRSTAYSLPASERILRGLKRQPLLIEPDEILHKERRVFVYDGVGRSPRGNGIQRSECCGVTRARAGADALG